MESSKKPSQHLPENEELEEESKDQLIKTIEAVTLDDI